MIGVIGIRRVHANEESIILAIGRTSDRGLLSAAYYLLHSRHALPLLLLQLLLSHLGSSCSICTMQPYSTTFIHTSARALVQDPQPQSSPSCILLIPSLFSLHRPNMSIDLPPLLQLLQCQVFSTLYPSQTLCRPTSTLKALRHIPFCRGVEERDVAPGGYTCWAGTDEPLSRGRWEVDVCCRCARVIHWYCQSL